MRGSIYLLMFCVLVICTALLLICNAEARGQPRVEEPKCWSTIGPMPPEKLEPNLNSMVRNQPVQQILTDNNGQVTIVVGPLCPFVSEK